ncbi:hypothetical protein SKAU_G00346570 [Synaphobranchus kaupii]|uniref:Uncharacterized protein n=1 Tax=Synaphobranchus kaupii TaxID=118154 RepID=A0A9Q1EJI2_SYNKA|nr:hypothetical protein SKAU_G00346570 [Synaphobranchus kaupii]
MNELQGADVLFTCHGVHRESANNSHELTKVALRNRLAISLEWRQPRRTAGPHSAGSAKMAREPAVSLVLPRFCRQCAGPCACEGATTMLF